MKHTLPWNVTGIPPEAREIARAAANREGCTVGEWLTRRIIANGTLKAPVSEPQAEPTGPLPELEPPRPREDFAFRHPHAEASDGAFRRIDETFRNLAHRMENNERAQIEAHRAMNMAASEINAATRDQAEAFEHITTRIERVERQTDTSGLRDAMRGLHQGLSRLAEQIATITTESAAKLTTLAGNVEMLTGNVASTREDSSFLGQAIEDKLSALDERVKLSEERLKQTEERVADASGLNRTVAILQSHVNATEERMQDLLGRYLEGIEHSLEQIGERLEQAEIRGESDGGIEQVLHSLAASVAAVENQESPATEPESRSVEPIEAAVENTVDLDDFDTTELPPAPSFLARDLAPPPVADAEDIYHAPDLNPGERFIPAAEPVHTSTENYLAQARRAARPVEERDPDDRSMMSRLGIPGSIDGGQHRRVTHPVAVAFLVLLVIGAGVMVTRNLQRGANVAALDSSNLIALDAPRTGTPAQGTPSHPAAVVQQPAEARAPDTAQANSVASASVFPFGDPSTTPGLAELVAKANAGDARAELSLGLKYADGEGLPLNEMEAAYWLQKAAIAGEAVAQYRLGTLFERGLGVTADAGEALHWYGEAAKRGNRRAMHNLAVVYADGTGTGTNFAEAARWFKSAAELGLTDSQFNLGVLYERGLGVKSSLAEAYKWYSIAAAAGDSESKARVDALTSQIAPADRDATEKAVKAYKPRPIDLAANDG